MEVPEVDLHGYTVPNALLEVENTLSQYEDTQNETVCFIVGKGLHSEGNIPRLKPAVSNWLQQNNYNLERHPNEGRIYVKPGRRRLYEASCRIQVELDEQYQEELAERRRQGEERRQEEQRRQDERRRQMQIYIDEQRQNYLHAQNRTVTATADTRSTVEAPTQPCIPRYCKILLGVAAAAALVGGGLYWLLSSVL